MMGDEEKCRCGTRREDEAIGAAADGCRASREKDEAIEPRDLDMFMVRKCKAVC